MPVLIAGAFVLDLIIGDPPRRTHPVILMGRLISLLERLLWKEQGQKQLLLRGSVLALAVLGVIGGAAWGVIWLTSLISPYLSAAFQVWFLSTTLALRDLAGSALKVENELASGRLMEARQSVGLFVGRDTVSLSGTEVCRAAVESVAENTADGVIAPLFFAFLGGLPLVMMYKAINTMDSMLGYRSPRYLYFGRPAARFDDLVNFIPARITALFFLLSGFALKLDWKAGWRAVIRDSRNHPSPNSGFPEAAVAGLLNIRLGGPVCYGGREEFRPYIGFSGTVAPKHIRLAVKLLYLSSFLFVVTGLLLWVLIYKIA